MIEYDPQNTGSELGLFQVLFANCQTPEDAQRLISQMLGHLSIQDLGHLATVNRTLHHFIYSVTFFRNVKPLSAVLAFYQEPYLIPQKVDEARRKIIELLKAGEDPTQIKPDENPFVIGAQGNTALTAALVRRDEVLINAIFDIFEPGHPIFSLRDIAFCGKNTPLSLALKTGRYDLAERLVVEKNCDVDGLIGDHECTTIHALHLCAFLLGTLHGKADEQEGKLVRIIKAILERSHNKDVKLYYGQTPLDILMLDIGSEDFDCYEDCRDFFEWHSDKFTQEEVVMGKKIVDEIFWGKFTLENLDEKYHKLVRFAEAFAQLKKSQREVNSARDTFDEVRASHKVLVDKIHGEIPEIAAYHSRKQYFSLRELKQKYHGALPKSIEEVIAGIDFQKEYFMPCEYQLQCLGIPKFFKGTTLRTRTYNVLYMLQDHGYWHRGDLLSPETYDRRVAYFSSEKGQQVREELCALMKPSLSPRSSR